MKDKLLGIKELSCGDDQGLDYLGIIKPKHIGDDQELDFSTGFGEG